MSELERSLRHHVRGEVLFDAGARGMYTNDASNYRRIPIGVVRPLDAEDVVATVALCREHGAPLVMRGGGTSLAGQAVNEAVVVDCSKYMTGIAEPDTAQKTVVVQPGAILDHIRARTQPHGLTFGPDPSTHDRCTIGGMLGNDACGVHALQSEFYGSGPRTADNLRSLEVLTYDGLRLTVGRTDEAEIDGMRGRAGEIYRGLRALRDRYAKAIRERFPPIQRRVSGYNLPNLLPEQGFHVGRALVGSESTCVIVLSATLELCRHFPHQATLVLGYPDLYAATDEVMAIRELRPIGLEGIDHKLIEFIGDKHLHEQYLRLMPEGKAFLFVEFGADSVEEARRLAEDAKRRLGGGRDWPRGAVYWQEEDQQHIWKVRESGLGATAFVPGHPDTWEGWEDSAVAPERLTDYLRELHRLFDEYGYDVSTYGHFGQGCVHCRIPFDLRSPEGVRKFVQFTADAARLVTRMGGSISGEHGDGQARSDLLPIMYGPELVEAFGEFKRIWDPAGRMNPGRIVDPAPRDADLRLAGYPPWEPKTHFAFTADDGRFSRAAMRCVGVGKCRRTEGGVMCPSYMVTREERHTTRGRARLLYEMIEGDVVRGGWRSEEVHEALELCLACKGCKSDCPVSVDMATYKAEFLSHYYAGRLRPRRQYAMGLIRRWAAIGSRVPELVNLFTQTPGLRVLARFAAGVSQKRRVPRFAPRTFREWFAGHRTNEGGHRVVLFPDTFNDHFHPETLQAAVEVLEDAGCRVEIPERRICCGRPLFDFGMLGTARRWYAELLDTLSPYAEARVPIVGLEPSCVASLRDELPDLMRDDPRAERVSRDVFTLSEFLVQVLDGYEPPKLRR
jgi:FAD/FMN-containing dehydrogenase/Fe-S oxidoreductase